jgi:hypothetical protein
MQPLLAHHPHQCTLYRCTRKFNSGEKFIFQVCLGQRGMHARQKKTSSGGGQKSTKKIFRYTQAAWAVLNIQVFIPLIEASLNGLFDEILFGFTVGAKANPLKHDLP